MCPICLRKEEIEAHVKGKVTHSYELHERHTQLPVCSALQKDPQTKDENQQK